MAGIVRPVQRYILMGIIGAGIVKGGVPTPGVKEVRTKPNGTISLKAIPVAAIDHEFVNLI